MSSGYGPPTLEQASAPERSVFTLYRFRNTYPDMYRYRVDSQEPLTRLTTSLNPRRWDSKKSDNAPHKPLIATQVALPPGHGIYRIDLAPGKRIPC